jgi:hypothetical protein
MVIVHWFPERRSRYERHLLDIYLAELHRNEIEYTRGSLLADYRFSVLRELATPILGHAWGVPADIWWNHLERVFLSIDDWDALALLD